MSDVYYTVAHRNQKEIDSFKNRYDNFNTSLIPTIFKKSLGYTVVNVQQSTSWGSSHVVYFVTIKNKDEPLVFRANLGFNKTPEIVMKVEKLICEAVAKLHVPTNKIIYVDISRKVYPFDFQIQECLEGSDIENNFKGTQKEYDKLSFDLGAYIAIYTQIKYDLFGKFDSKAIDSDILKGTKNTFYEYITTCLEQDLKFLTDYHVVSINTKKEILNLFNQHEPIINNVKKGSLVHHDLADHNIFFKNNTITGIFDWEAAVVGDPVLDLSSCPTWRTIYPREETLIEGYKSITPLPKYFKEKMDIYRLRTMLWKTVYVIRMSIFNDARKQKFIDSLKPFKLSIL